MAERPNIVDPQMLDFLDEYRKTRNPYGARRDLKEAFNLDNKDATIILKHWMATFEKRHAQPEITVEEVARRMTDGND